MAFQQSWGGATRGLPSASVAEGAKDVAVWYVEVAWPKVNLNARWVPRAVSMLNIFHHVYILLVTCELIWFFI